MHVYMCVCIFININIYVRQSHSLARHVGELNDIKHCASVIYPTGIRHQRNVGVKRGITVPISSACFEAQSLDILKYITVVHWQWTIAP